MPNKSYNVETSVVTTTQTYRTVGPSGDIVTETTETKTTNDDGKKTTVVTKTKNKNNKETKDVKKTKSSNEKSSFCASLCCCRGRKSSLSDDETIAYDKKNKKKESVTVTGRRDISTPTVPKKLSLKEFRDKALKAHNLYRQKHKVPPLVLSDKLNGVAQAWAEHMANSRLFGHSRNENYGENIFFGQRTGAGMSAEEAVKNWYEEIKDYSFTRPNLSGTGHFTQVVWKNSKQLGIGWVQNPDGATYVVANYDPPGNVIGQHQENVFPAK